MSLRALKKKKQHLKLLPNKLEKVLITGGTGSFGKVFVQTVLEKFSPKRVIVYSRDELKQSEMQAAESFNHPSLRFFLGDVRDRSRLSLAMRGVDYVVHAAALKQVPAAEYNPIEFIKTNIVGSQNLIEACFYSEVKKVIALSTDKACSPVNLYGATKLCSDKLFVASNNFLGDRQLSFSVVRYGNVMGSRGSVIPYFLSQAKKGILPITNENMTRFNLSLDEGAELVLWSIINSQGGEIFVPKIPSYRLSDLADAIGPSCKRHLLGIRPGEKLHEEMISNTDIFNTVDLGDYYAILPNKEKITQYNPQKLMSNIFGDDFMNFFIGISHSARDLLV